MAKPRRSESLSTGGRSKTRFDAVFPTSKESADWSCGKIPSDSSLPLMQSSTMDPMLYELNQEMCGQFNVNLPSASFPNKLIICHYPKVNPPQPQRRSQTRFVRINYEKDLRQKSQSCHQTRLGAVCYCCCPKPAKTVSKRIRKAKVKEQKSSSDAHVCLKELKVPYIDLGYRCDSKEFKEQQACVSISKKCELIRIAEKKQDNPRKPFKMERYDYKRGRDGAPLSSFGKPMGSPVTKSLHIGPRTSSRIRNARRFADVCCDSSSSMQKSGMQLSVVKWDEDSASQNEKLDTGFCKIVNLPIDIVSRREEADGAVIMDSEKFLTLMIERMNKNCFTCIDCGSRLLASTMMKQLCDSKRMG